MFPLTSPDSSHSPITHKRGSPNARQQFHLFSDRLLQRSLCWPTKVYYKPSRLSLTRCGSHDIWPLQIRSHKLRTKGRAVLAALPQRVIYKLCLTTYKAINGTAPSYIPAMRVLSSTNQTRLRLRSSDSCQLLLPRTKTEFGEQAFACAGPHAWNDLLIYSANINNPHRVQISPKNTSFALLLSDLLNIINYVMAVPFALFKYNMDINSTS